ncbi:acyl carrier protein phosphodiesterase [Mangrovitalea sediminis]|uniref:acyl carrier protein phosphodiesterase n=1 Tax=Mangrovitalea sediminis TaxID=1982043 RepID=UPI000BE56A9E|nr:ACP phosphodiesterase [Mangrovitalea sediminis]
MNHLAHVFLAPDTPEARIGSILGDFSRGLTLEELTPELQRGVQHHRAVDSYTDRHPQVRASKRLFSQDRRRFAGVALDILYDHYLLKHWDRFSELDREAFIQRVYAEFAEYEHLMPDPMARVTRRMAAQDWFGQYQRLENIGYALDRVAQRIRFPNRFEGIIIEIQSHNAELEDRFIAFFADLQQHARGF